MPTQDDAAEAIERAAVAITTHYGPFDREAFEPRAKPGEVTRELFAWFQRPGEWLRPLPDGSMVSHETRINDAQVKVELWINGELTLESITESPASLDD